MKLARARKESRTVARLNAKNFPDSSNVMAATCRFGLEFQRVGGSIVAREGEVVEEIGHRFLPLSYGRVRVSEPSARACEKKFLLPHSCARQILARAGNHRHQLVVVHAFGFGGGGKMSRTVYEDYVPLFSPLHSSRKSRIL